MGFWSEVFTTFGLIFFVAGEAEAQPLEQDGLMVGRLGDAAAADLRAAARGQDHIDQLDLAQLLEHATRLVAQPGGLDICCSVFQST